MVQTCGQLSQSGVCGAGLLGLLGLLGLFGLLGLLDYCIFAGVQLFKRSQIKRVDGSLHVTEHAS